MIDCKKKCYVVQIQLEKEGFAKAMLKLKFFDIFFLMYQTVKRHARQNKMVLKPQFPGHIFIQLDLKGLSCFTKRRRARFLAKVFKVTEAVMKKFIDVKASVKLLLEFLENKWSIFNTPGILNARWVI